MGKEILPMKNWDSLTLLVQEVIKSFPPLFSPEDKISAKSMAKRAEDDGVLPEIRTGGEIRDALSDASAGINVVVVALCLWIDDKRRSTKIDYGVIADAVWFACIKNSLSRVAIMRLLRTGLFVRDVSIRNAVIEELLETRKIPEYLETEVTHLHGVSTEPLSSPSRLSGSWASACRSSRMPTFYGVLCKRVVRRATGFSGERKGGIGILIQGIADLHMDVGKPSVKAISFLPEQMEFIAEQKIGSVSVPLFTLLVRKMNEYARRSGGKYEGRARDVSRRCAISLLRSWGSPAAISSWSDHPEKVWREWKDASECILSVLGKEGEFQEEIRVFRLWMDKMVREEEETRMRMERQISLWSGGRED